MEERWLTLAGRGGALLVMLAGASWAWNLFGPQAMNAYQVWRYPPIRARLPLGDALKSQVDGVRRAELTAQYKRVMAALDDAERQGLAVGELREKLPTGARMIRAGQFEYARVYLTSIEARVPRKRESLVPAGTEVEPEEASPPGRPAPPRPKAPVRKRPVRKGTR